MRAHCFAPSLLLCLTACAIGAPLPMRSAPAPAASVDLRFTPPRDVVLERGGARVVAPALAHALAWVVEVRHDSVRCEVGEAAGGREPLEELRGATFWVAMRDTTVAMTPHAGDRAASWARREAAASDRLLAPGAVVRVQGPGVPLREAVLQRRVRDTLLLAGAGRPGVDTVPMGDLATIDVRDHADLGTPFALLGAVAGAAGGYQLTYEDDKPCVPDPNSWFSCVQFFPNLSGVPGALGGMLVGALVGKLLGSQIRTAVWHRVVVPSVAPSPGGRVALGLRVAF